MLDPNGPTASATATARGSAHSDRSVLLTLVVFKKKDFSCFILVTSLSANKIFLLGVFHKPIHFEVSFACVCQIKAKPINPHSPHVL